MSEKLYGFEQERTTELVGINTYYRYQKESLVVAEVTSELSEELSLQMLDVELKSDKIQGYMQALKCHFLLLMWNEQEEARLCFVSDTKRVRALEFLDYLLPGFGLVKGDGKIAGGRIASAILKVQMSEIDLTNWVTYFLKMSDSYFSDCDCIMAAEYGIANADVIPSMQHSVKKKVPWGVVKSLDVAKEGEHICIKSLENESGLEITAAPDRYIMIGYRGEIYDIGREKFESTYETTQELLDVFSMMLDFLPEAEIVHTGTYVSLDEIAHVCYPKPGAGVYVKQLEKRTKVFPVGEGQEYFLGRPGDYLAVRSDDFCDVYVIEREIFGQTYE